MAGDRCEYCGKSGARVECAHIFGRRAKSTRWDLNNAVSLCHHHHRHFTENPILFFDWIAGYIGEEKLDALRLKSHQVKKWTAAEKADLYQSLKGKLAKYE